MRSDVDQDGINDEDSHEAPLTAQHLEMLDILNHKAAKSLMQHYCSVCPAVQMTYRDSVAMLEHTKFYRDLQVVDRIRSELHGEERLELEDAVATQGPVIIPIDKMADKTSEMTVDKTSNRLADMRSDQSND